MFQETNLGVEHLIFPLFLEDGKNVKNEIKSLLEKHIELTQSTVAKYILDDWKQQSEHFIKVFPKEYKAVLAKKENVKQKVN